MRLKTVSQFFYFQVFKQKKRVTEEVYVCGIRINFDVITNFENETFHYDSQFFIKLFLQDEKFHSNDTFNHHHFLSISRDNYQPNVPKKT